MRIELSESIRISILNYIRAGGYDWVAAEAAGIPSEVFHDWMRKGASDSSGPLREFFVDVMKARSQSRLKAEIDLREENTLAWLRYGPGREQLGRPGWTESVSIDAKQAWDEVAKLHSECFDLVGAIAARLAGFPEARQAVIDLIEHSPVVSTATDPVSHQRQLESRRHHPH